MAWIYLLIAGLTEIIWAFGLKYSYGFTEAVPSIITVLFMVISFYLFSKSITAIPIGTAYAVFTGIGAAGTVIAGIFLGETLSFLKVVFLIVLLSGIIGLKMTTTDVSEEKGEKL
ncbi:quaternary ammonium compound-resistance protein SugE [Peribacillus deserti]|uniref:Quaternary ammonium compound-resistance protein SugE n=1 Tax=Peribacillus deserti TaxID=673318 RepID=A0ABS2QNI1_9BACI|nr:multidrug efflux SMR transporter [Peribacillus deserti]MBM7694575.1 quaternary ammonium compound-resistance protein SugE [Peribacillus deserti]